MPEPTREIFWNVDLHWPMYIMAALAVLVLFYAIYFHIKRWKVGKPSDRANRWGKRILDHLYLNVVDLALHRKFLGFGKPYRWREFYPGLMHFFIFGGFVVFFLATVIDSLSYYTNHFLKGNFYLGYSV